MNNVASLLCGVIKGNNNKFSSTARYVRNRKHCAGGFLFWNEVVGTFMTTRELRISLVVLDSRFREATATTYKLNLLLPKYQSRETTLGVAERENF